MTKNKIKTLAQIKKRCSNRDFIITAASGCFDILHAGHIQYLEKAAMGGEFLVVGINSDDSVRGLKGHGRPINTQKDRARVIAALDCVGAVCIFNDDTAVEFLKAVRPARWYKGGDYTLQTVNQDERRAVEAHGGRVMFVKTVPDRSTTRLIEDMNWVRGAQRLTRNNGVRYEIAAAQIEFDDGGHTMWVHGLQGATILRIKAAGKISARLGCENVCSHADITVPGDIEVCVAACDAP